MTADPHRAQRRFLGLVAPPRSRSDEELVPPTEVVLQSPARATLDDHLHSPGLCCGGALYGHSVGGVLTVRLAAPGGYAWWLPQNAPLAMDERYLLGWGDCLASLYGGATGWVGQWMMYPHRHFESLEEDLAWLNQAVWSGLVDDDHPLLVVGWNDGALSVRGYRFTPGSREIAELSLAPGPAGSARQR